MVDDDEYFVSKLPAEAVEDIDDKLSREAFRETGSG